MQVLFLMSKQIAVQFVLLCLALIGVGAVLYSSAMAFKFMKWLGVAYLIYIGVKQWRVKPAPMGEVVTTNKIGSSKRMFLQGFLATLFNPKLIGWFVGQVMKATGGKANPKTVNELVAAKLNS